MDTLATDVLQTDLSHITGENVVAKDKTSLRNLIEIFSVLMEVLLEATEGNYIARYLIFTKV